MTAFSDPRPHSRTYYLLGALSRSGYFLPYFLTGYLLPYSGALRAVAQRHAPRQLVPPPDPGPGPDPDLGPDPGLEPDPDSDLGPDLDLGPDPSKNKVSKNNTILITKPYSKHYFFDLGSLDPSPYIKHK